MTDPKPITEKQNLSASADKRSNLNEDTSTKRGFFDRVQQAFGKSKLVHPSEEAEIVIIPEDEVD